jgi:hypothetical protein
MARFTRQWVCGAGAVCAPLFARAAETATAGTNKLKDFGLAASNSGSLPIGRVIFAFVLVAALAWGVTWVLRRYGFRGALLATPGAAPIRAVARTTLPGGVTCHVIETQGRHLLITVTRHGVSSVVLGDADPPTSPTTP